MENYCYFLIVLTSILLGCCVKLKIEKRQDLDFGKHFKPKKHFLFEHCSQCGKRLKHYQWFWGKGDFMGCEVDYNGNTEWFCEECENELNKNVLHRIPTQMCTQMACIFNSDCQCKKTDGEICPLSNIAHRSDNL